MGQALIFAFDSDLIHSLLHLNWVEMAHVQVVADARVW